MYLRVGACVDVCACLGSIELRNNDAPRERFSFTFDVVFGGTGAAHQPSDSAGGTTGVRSTCAGDAVYEVPGAVVDELAEAESSADVVLRRVAIEVYTAAASQSAVGGRVEIRLCGERYSTGWMDLEPRLLPHAPFAPGACDRFVIRLRDPGKLERAALRFTPSVAGALWACDCLRIGPADGDGASAYLPVYALLDGSSSESAWAGSCGFDAPVSPVSERHYTVRLHTAQCPAADRPSFFFALFFNFSGASRRRTPTAWAGPTVPESTASSRSFRHRPLDPS